MPIQTYDQKRVLDKFYDLCMDAQEEIPPNVIAKIHRDYADRLDWMKKIICFGFWYFLFSCPNPVHAWEISE